MICFLSVILSHYVWTRPLREFLCVQRHDGWDVSSHGGGLSLFSRKPLLNTGLLLSMSAAGGFSRTFHDVTNNRMQPLCVCAVYCLFTTISYSVKQNQRCCGSANRKTICGAKYPVTHTYMMRWFELNGQKYQPKEQKRTLLLDNCPTLWCALHWPGQ